MPFPMVFIGALNIEMTKNTGMISKKSWYKFP